MNNRLIKQRANVTLALFSGLALIAVAVVLVLSGRSPEAVLAIVVVVCQRSINETLTHGADLSSLFILIPFGLGVVLATIKIVQVMITTRRWVASFIPLDCPPDGQLRSLAYKCGLAHPPIQLCTNHAIVFTHGLFKPKIWLSTGLLRELDDDELEAVLWHETYHLRARDPLKMLVVLFLRQALFFIPLAHDLFDSYWASKEIAADRQTIDAMGDTLPLVRALRKLTVSRPTQPSKMAPISQFSGMEARLLALLNPDQHAPFFPVERLSLNLVWLLIFIAAVMLPLPGHMPSLTECAAPSAFQSEVFLGLPGFLFT